MSNMLELFKPLKKVFKIDLKEPTTDNNVFKLHYRASVLVLLVCASLVGWKEYIGDPIICISDQKIPEKMINAYCWTMSTFTLPRRAIDRLGEDAAPGVGLQDDGDEEKTHKYYQWVCISLFLQAMLFKVPRSLWSICERGRMKSMVQDLDQPVVTKKTEKERKGLLFDHLKYSFGHQNHYFYRFFLCEVLNFVNVVGQIYYMDLFLDGDFMHYGTQVMDCDWDLNECDPMSRIFPKVSKCNFFKFGPSGTLQKYDALCVLSINIISEKIYVFLWFWYMVVATITGFMMAYRVCVMMSFRLRTYLLSCRAWRCQFRIVESICYSCEIGDWFVLYQLSRNIDQRIFVELLRSIDLHVFSSCVGANPCRNSSRKVRFRDEIGESLELPEKAVLPEPVKEPENPESSEDLKSDTYKVKVVSLDDVESGHAYCFVKAN
ncbi:innexin inx2-like [Thrips palmi]|uniref:Innexin n=1 Tax=Thrips palmi TaxID=161013 RepID=A0A6P8ZNF7_THRPL|nr:innexin inx2-like [Thrips palmi]